MAFYNTCPVCGANLDPGESCDCQEEKELEAKKIQSMIKVEKNGQMQFNFLQEVIDVDKAAVR